VHKGRIPLGELPGLATSFQLVRLLGCGLNQATKKAEIDVGLDYGV